MALGCLWYVAQWGIILTVNTYVHSLYGAFSVVIGISPVLTIVSRVVSKRTLKYTSELPIKF